MEAATASRPEPPGRLPLSPVAARPPKAIVGAPRGIGAPATASGARGAARDRARPAPLGRQAGVAVLLQLRRGDPFRPAGDRVLPPRLQPAVLPQPARLLVPAAFRLRALVRQRRRGPPGLRDRPDRGVRRRPRGRGECSGRSPSGSRIWPASGCSTRRSRCSGRRSSGSRSCRSSTATWRSTTCRRCAPVALSLYGVAGVLRNGARRDYVLAGVGIGLAAATKYTGGFTAICLLAAFGLRSRRGRRGSLAAAPGAGGRVRAAGVRGRQPILGARLLCLSHRPHDPAVARGWRRSGEARHHVRFAGLRYYIWTFTWGLGWVPSLAALAGAALLLIRRRLALALVLLPAPVAFIVFMGDQQRFFGRWLMPIFPIVALLGAYARRRGGAVADRRAPDPAAGGVDRRDDGAARPERRLRRPRRPGAFARRHPQPDPRLDGGPHPGWREGGGRAGRLR